jgi:hypothetical protein
MQSTSYSQCQLVRLQIDAMLDGELEPARKQEFNLHIKGCEACRYELTYAWELHRSVTNLPILNCSDQALEPIDRLIASSKAQMSADKLSWWEQLQKSFSTMPGPLRYALPGIVVVLVLLGPGRQLMMPRTSVDELANESVSNAEPQYSQTEIMQAMADLQFALSYLNVIGERTSELVQNRFLLRQLDASINWPSRDDERAANDEPKQGSNGPI